MSIDIAGAPVSFGVFELADPAAIAALPGPDRICEVLAEAGYRGIDLGPVGFLGLGEELRERLSRWSLPLAGGWIDLPFSDDARFAAALPGLDAALAAFDAARGVPGRAAKPTLADSGDDRRRAHPGGGAGLSLEGEALDRFAANVQTAVERIRSAGFEPTFHHHVGTYIETPDEIDAFLDRTDVGLTFDTGHLLLGGGDPLAGWRRWRARIDHLHLKDVDLAVLRTVRECGGGMTDVWASRAFVPFADGDLAIREMVQAIVADGYDGWLVVEQDVLAGPEDSARAEADQRDNIERLTALLDAAASGAR